MHHAARFWDWIADRYARQPVADEAAYELKLAVTRDYLCPDADVLELGCGTGSTALRHAPHVRRIEAVDVSAGMLAIAREKAAAQAIANVVFRRVALEEAIGGERRWGAVLGLNVLHLVADPAGVVAAIHDALEPGGVFITSTPCLGDMGWGYRLMAGAMRVLPLLPSVQVFGEDAFVGTLETAGFEVMHRWRPGPTKATFIVARRPI